MEYGVRVHLIREDPVTCALYFNHCFYQLMKTWKMKNGPFGTTKLTTSITELDFSTEGFTCPHADLAS
jgi:hypothetical protein